MTLKKLIYATILLFMAILLYTSIVKTKQNDKLKVRIEFDQRHHKIDSMRIDELMNIIEDQKVTIHKYQNVDSIVHERLKQIIIEREKAAADNLKKIFKPKQK